jgi:cytochrome c peroxidase
MGMTDIAKSIAGIVLVLVCMGIIGAGKARPQDIAAWTKQEKEVLRSLWIGSLGPLPKNPSNAFADNPKAAALGKKFFFDSRFSGNLKVSCATCHPPNRNFADDLPLAHGMGTTTRRTMPLIGVGYNTWFFWDGRKDSLWAQALGPIENPVEHGFTRTQCAAIIMMHYQTEYEEIFGPFPEFLEKDLPPLAKPSLDEPEALKAWVSMPQNKKDAVNTVYANMGKAIAAFVRTVVPGPSRFDRYTEAVLKGEKAEKILTPEEVKGLRLFIGKAKCINCHNGPLLTNGGFHNVGVPQPPGLPADRGRADAISKVLSDEYNCLSVYSDARPKDCGELRFLDVAVDKYVEAFKTPTLRNVAERAPYMHAGQFKTLREVLDFYRKPKPGGRVSPEIEHLDLSDEEIIRIESFLKTLSGPVMVGDTEL